MRFRNSTIQQFVPDFVICSCGVGPRRGGMVPDFAVVIDTFTADVACTDTQASFFIAAYYQYHRTPTTDVYIELVSCAAPCDWAAASTGASARTYSRSVLAKTHAIHWFSLH